MEGGEIMKCPICGSKTTVTETRDGGVAVKRRRKCMKCGFRYKTTETKDEYRRKEK